MVSLPEKDTSPLYDIERNATFIDATEPKNDMDRSSLPSFSEKIRPLTDSSVKVQLRQEIRRDVVSVPNAPFILTPRTLIGLCSVPIKLLSGDDILIMALCSSQIIDP